MAQNTSLPDPRSTGLGILLILGAVFLMAAQDALIKYASANLALSQIFILRSGIVVPVLLILATGTVRPIWRQALGRWSLARSAMLTCMYLCLYAALPHLPLSTLAAGFYIGPLFITLLSARALNEPVNQRGWIGIGIGFVGVLVLLRPGADSFTLWGLVPVLSGLCYAIAAILARGHCQTMSPIALALSLNIALLGAGIALVCLGQWGTTPDSLSFLLRRWSALRGSDWTLILVLALFMVGIGMGLAAAYQLAPPVIIASFDYAYLIFATGFGVILFAEQPDGPTLAGMALILTAGMITAFDPARKSAG